MGDFIVRIAVEEGRVEREGRRVRGVTVSGGDEGEVWSW